MDQEKIGKFIATCRKEKNLTQNQLAKKLQITNKAISKWETGRGMPDSSLLLQLCKILDINVNELLSGEKLHTEKYQKKAEENILAFAKESDKNKIYLKRIIIVFSIIIIVFFIMFGISKYAGGFLIGKDGEFSSNIVMVNEKLTHIVISSENEIDNVKTQIIYSFKKDKCVSERIKYLFLDENVANEQYEIWKQIKELTNLEKSGNEVSFNTNAHVGETKQEILNNNRMEYEIY